jgi:uncharacterized membrane protein
VLATALDPSTGVEDTAWRRKLSEDYRIQKVKIPLDEAYAHRLRRVYLPLFLVLFVVAPAHYRVCVPPVAHQCGDCYNPRECCSQRG